ncbi:MULTISPECIES: dihydroxyacetone kinase phosphoryl donor subunit DhaM [unclassified Cellulomonas]|jgi:phosphoenolpyruvate---glycerone phosphotransferase subunit DhaM|uniref:dihydroxyacetone kinase phosphoryl donor subunit DhaM n=1 Tax=unclassified Cellulomonas TaxID=2620175 RepID=UPI001C2F9D4D|nr:MULTISPECIES: dihydroxyacetone kinase phosphoryl donor subunit DhaM [unclassified Cellulomonas]MBW0254587.1 HPr family phosphocarrier protein [Cellulomonas sp. PS-H5]
MTAPVALVLVSHSATLAEGVRELAAQMAPEVLIVAAGGDGAGGLGTSFDLVEQALGEATADGRSAVVLTDLGSAVLTTESVLEFLDEDVAARVHLADAPFVEAAVAAGVTAAGGAPVGEVLGAAVAAGAGFPHAAGPGEVAPEASAEPTPPAPPHAGDSAAPITAHVVVRNPMGLHARPAAVLARMMAGFDAAVQVDGVNGASVLELMQLAATQGRTLEVTATGPQARVAVDAFVGAVEEGFGEV